MRLEARAVAITILGTTPNFVPRNRQTNARDVAVIFALLTDDDNKKET